MFKERTSFLLVVLTVLFSTALIVSNIIAGKLWNVGFLGMILPSGALLFPIVYIIGDVIPEVYGLRLARRTIFLGFAANLFAVVFFFITLGVPFPGFWQGQAAFETVLGFTPRLLIASFTAFLIGSNVNAWIMVFMKKTFGMKFLWTRTITSTIVGEGIDSAIFVTIAFIGVMPGDVLLTTILSQWLFKTAYETLATPITYWVVNKVKRAEGVDQYHTETITETAWSGAK